MVHTKIKELNIWGGTYATIEQVPDNRDIVDSVPNGQIKPIWNGTQWIESATNEQILSKEMQKETQNYLQRVNDGVMLVSQFGAKLRVAKLNGVIDEESHKIIDDTLIPVRTEVLAGQFKSAKYRLEEIGTAIIGQSLYDEILTELTNYISVNYVR